MTKKIKYAVFSKKQLLNMVKHIDRKAVEYNVDESQAYARLAYLLEKLEPDPRETLRLLRIAVQKAPENADFHCRLGESYASQELTLNARREFTAALKIDKNLTRAKTGLSNL